MDRPPDLVESTHKNKTPYQEKIPKTLSASNGNSLDNEIIGYTDSADTADNVGGRGDQQILLSHRVVHNISTGNANGDQQDHVFHQHGPKTPDETYPKFVQLTPDKECAESTEAATNIEDLSDKNTTWYQGSENSSLAGDEEDSRPCDDSKYEEPAKLTDDLPERPLKDISLTGYFYAELTRGYMLENDEAKFKERRERIYTFLKIPKEVERFMVYGFFQCVDAFLFVFTFLPLRVILALARLATCSCYIFSRRTGRLMEPAQICDLLKGIILVSACILMSHVDVSMMYHIVRGQAIIKLYLFFNMLEIADKLFSSVGQDILDALFWTATEPRGRRREHLGTLPHLLLAIGYVVIHACLVLFQATTLNVAFNSHNKSLLTIMMSNNFVELKGSVFKKFAKNNLFQMSCSDVRERFHFMILLFIVCLRNLTEMQWNMDHLWVLMPDVVLVLVAEVFVDWVKHAFITKFNEIPEEVYREYTVSIAYDMASSRQKTANSDHLDLVSRRMGFIPLPVAVLLLRVILPVVNINSFTAVFIVILAYLCLTTFKIANSIILLGIACDLISENKEKMKEQQNPEKPKSDSVGILKRRHSFCSKPNQNVKFTESEKAKKRSPSLGAKPLYSSNSMVNLGSSMSLNEEFVNDSKCMQEGLKKENTELRHRKPDDRKKNEQPLSEIDRFTLVSSQIV